MVIADWLSHARCRTSLASAHTRAPPCKTIALLAAANDDTGGKRVSATTLAYNPASQIAGQTSTNVVKIFGLPLRQYHAS